VELKDRVLGVLASSDEPLKAQEIAGVLGAAKAEVDKALKELKNQEKIISPKRCYYHVERK